MNRKIPNRPHPTPHPDQPHATPGSDRSELARTVAGAQGAPAPFKPPQVEPAVDDEPTYDSCFDDLNAVLSQSMEEPDPDPNLVGLGGSPSPDSAEVPDIAGKLPPAGRPPRTSEIFRSVVAGAAIDPARPTDRPVMPARPSRLGRRSRAWETWNRGHGPHRPGMAMPTRSPGMAACRGARSCC